LLDNAAELKENNEALINERDSLQRKNLELEHALEQELKLKE
jgi:hypothetical protein